MSPWGKSSANFSLRIPENRGTSRAALSYLQRPNSKLFKRHHRNPIVSKFISKQPTFINNSVGWSLFEGSVDRSYFIFRKMCLIHDLKYCWLYRCSCLCKFDVFRRVVLFLWFFLSGWLFAQVLRSDFCTNLQGAPKLWRPKCAAQFSTFLKFSRFKVHLSSDYPYVLL